MVSCGSIFSQAIETGFGYGVWLHGEAVAAGMVLILPDRFLTSTIMHQSLLLFAYAYLVWVFAFRSWLLTCHTALVGLMICL
jgi:hypothetical protein